jgi:aminoglycoside phosphotransferase (APT) family kinase protein
VHPDHLAHLPEAGRFLPRSARAGRGAESPERPEALRCGGPRWRCARVSEWDPARLYRAARCAGPDAMSGYYHHNVRVDPPGGPVLVRIPLPGAEQMDLHIWEEWDVLRAVAPHVDLVPRLLHVSADPPYQIHEFVAGRQLNRLAPRGSPVPPAVVPGVLALFDRLSRIPLEALPPLPEGWPDAEQSSDFARLLSGHTQRVHDENRVKFGALFRALRIPDDPLATIVAGWPALRPRPFQLLHADVHRQNLLISPRGVVFLDWELALWGDPVYDLAVHIHKMTYLDDELRGLLDRWEAATGLPGTSWRDDLAAYLRHEQAKSALVHTIRYTKEIVAEHTTEARRALLIGKLTRDLNTAARIWGRAPTLNPPEVSTLITTHAPKKDR